jgi:hypothetical protein
MSDELELAPIEARDAEWPHRVNVEQLALDRRALLAEVKRLRATTPEWEWGVHHVNSDGYAAWVRHDNREQAEKDFASCGMNCDIARRTKGIPAGPWLPVPDPTPDNEGNK